MKKQGGSRTEERELRRYRKFYQAYPQIRDSMTPELIEKLLPQTPTEDVTKRDSTSPILIIPGKKRMVHPSKTINPRASMSADKAVAWRLYETWKK